MADVLVAVWSGGRNGSLVAGPPRMLRSSSRDMFVLGGGGGA